MSFDKQLALLVGYTLPALIFLVIGAVTGSVVFLTIGACGVVGACVWIAALSYWHMAQARIKYIERKQHND